jgi:hypothetical protein
MNKPITRMKLMWSLGFLEMNKRKEIFDKIIELTPIDRDEIRIGRLFVWSQTSEGNEFWGNLAMRQLKFIKENIFTPLKTIIEVDE